MIKFVDLGRQYESVKPEVDAALQKVLDTTAFVLGPNVQRFEGEFAAYCSAHYCIGVANGTDALTIALEAMGVSHGDEVIVPANTFIATALAVSHVGARVVPVDVDPVTKLITAEQVEPAITERTKAVIPVHLFGKPVDMDPLLVLCRDRGILVLEDGCQAHGARYKGRRVGALGDAAAFSFYPGKNLGAYGDGGAITTSDATLADRIRLIRDLGQKQKYVHVIKGRNSRLDALQAAILSAKLPHLDSWNERRRAHAARYDQLFAERGIATNSQSSGESVQHLYCIAVDNREDLMKVLDDRGIGCGIHYPTPIHLHEAYRELGFMEGAFPVSERWSNQTLSLPMFAELTDAEVDEVVDTVSSAAALVAR